jgi:hypothetical protein
VDCAIDPAPAKQCRVRGIHNCIDMLPFDVALVYGYPLTVLVRHSDKDSCTVIKNVSPVLCSTVFLRLAYGQIVFFVGIMLVILFERE